MSPDVVGTPPLALQLEDKDRRKLRDYLGMHSMIPIFVSGLSKKTRLLSAAPVVQHPSTPLMYLCFLWGAGHLIRCHGP